MMTLDYVTTVPAHLADQLVAGAAQARRQRGPVLVSLTERIPWQDAVAFFERGAALAEERAFWEQPSAGWALAGVGAAQTFTAGGPDRFARVDAAWQALLAGALLSGTDPAAGAGPVLLGGFAFDPDHPATALWHGFPDALLVLPRFLLRSTATELWLTTNLVLWPDSDPAAEAGTLAHERTWLLSAEGSGRSAEYADGFNPHFARRPLYSGCASGGRVGGRCRGGGGRGARRAAGQGGTGPRSDRAGRAAVRGRRGAARAAGGVPQLLCVRGGAGGALLPGGQPGAAGAGGGRAGPGNVPGRVHGAGRDARTRMHSWARPC